MPLISNTHKQDVLMHSLSKFYTNPNHSKYLVSLGKIASHRRVMKLLDEELKTKIHALEITIK